MRKHRRNPGSVGNLLLKLLQARERHAVGQDLFFCTRGPLKSRTVSYPFQKKLMKNQSRSQIASFPLLLLLWKPSCTQVMRFMAGHEGMVALKKGDRAGNGGWAKLWMTKLHSWVLQLRTKEVVLIDIRQRSSFDPKADTHIPSILLTIGFMKDKAQDWGLWNISGNKLSRNREGPFHFRENKC